MYTDKKNQHYIPKFYLRNFSYKNNKKQIGIYNINSEFFFQNSKLKTQGSKNFYYGTDGKIEDTLSNIEDSIAKTINRIILTKELPRKFSEDHFLIILFVILTDIRNPTTIVQMKNYLEEMRKRVLELDPNADTNKFIPNPNHDEIIRLLFNNILDIAPVILDLDYKILINKTSTPFISSDFPIVKYNQYLELKKWPHSKTGYGSSGLQIFVPINHEILLTFFDKKIYKIGDKKKSIHNIINIKNINDINKLQFLNCINTIYFDEKTTEKYLKNLHEKSKKHKRANLTKSELSYLVKENDEDNKRTIMSGFKNFMIINTTDCEINLTIDGLKIHSNGLTKKLDNCIAQLRPHAKAFSK